MTLWRFAVDGSVDHDFGLNGRVRAGAPSGADALLQQPDGKLVAAGFGSDEGTGRRFAQITRFGTDGSIDVASAAGARFACWDRSSDLEAHAVAIQPDGRLVIAGSRFMSARFDPDGFVNLGYGVNGVVQSAIPTGDARLIAIQPDGRIVAAGATVDDVRHPAMAVTRLLGVAEAVPGAGRVIEYVDTGNFPAEPGGHFFYTLDGSAESRLVDSGTAGAFQRTRAVVECGRDVGRGALLRQHAARSELALLHRQPRRVGRPAGDAGRARSRNRAAVESRRTRRSPRRRPW